MDRLLQGPRDVRALADARLCAVGPGTASRLTRFGLKVDLVPDDHSADGVVAALEGHRLAEGQARSVPEGRHRARHAARGAARRRRAR